MNLLMPLRCAALLAASLLVGCASEPSGNISLPVAAARPAQPLETESIKWSHTPEGCRDNCPKVRVESVAFPGEPRLTRLVDHALATMADLDSDAPPAYGTLAEFEQTFWRVARAGNEVVLTAKVQHQTADLVVLGLESYQYLGGAHGIPGNQYLNWQRSSGRLLALRDVLLPGRHDAFVEQLKQAHARWLARNEDARNDLDAYNKLWPFEPSDNYALLADGVAIRYQPYVIAPHSHGQPVLKLSYEDLRGILKPEFLLVN